MSTNPTPLVKSEHGIFTRDPLLLPNPADLSNGRYGNQLRYGVLNLTDAKTVKQWGQVLEWFRSNGVPMDDISYYVPQNGGGYGATQVVFARAVDGKTIAVDATHAYNQPDTNLEILQANFGLTPVVRWDEFPGFDKLDAQVGDPVGEPDPSIVIPGRTASFPLFYKVSAAFNEQKYPAGSIFERLSTTGEVEAIFRRTIRMFSGGGLVNLGQRHDVRPYWERLR